MPEAERQAVTDYVLGRPRADGSPHSNEPVMGGGHEMDAILGDICEGNRCRMLESGNHRDVLKSLACMDCAVLTSVAIHSKRSSG